MNLLLLEAEDLSEGGTRARISGRRAEHIRTVLRAAPGDLLRVGVLGGDLGHARLVSLEEGRLELLLDPSTDPETGLNQPPPPPRPVTLVLCLPRPKVLRRLLAALPTFGVSRVFLLHAYRVDKAYWQSPHLSPASVRQALHLGLEQAGTTEPPEVELRRRFKPFVEDELPDLAAGTTALAPHPRAPDPCPRTIEGPLTLAIGPEGGFLPYEIDTLQEAGLDAVTLGPRILRVETAVPWLLGRLC